MNKFHFFCCAVVTPVAVSIECTGMAVQHADTHEHSMCSFSAIVKSRSQPSVRASRLKMSVLFFGVFVYLFSLGIFSVFVLVSFSFWHSSYQLHPLTRRITLAQNVLFMLFGFHFDLCFKMNKFQRITIFINFHFAVRFDCYGHV